MMNTYEFLTELSQDPHRQLQFTTDPERVLADAGLELRDIQDLDETATRALAERRWARAEFVFDPSYDPPPPDPDLTPAAAHDDAA